nr:MAG TPA: hypothetical protein [Caudoviricetes sp.]
MLSPESVRHLRIRVIGLELPIMLQYNRFRYISYYY